MTTAALHFTKTTAGRYAATAGGFRYLVQHEVYGDWTITINRTTTVAGVEIVDTDSRTEWAETEAKREAVMIANAFHELGNDYSSAAHGYASRFTTAVGNAYAAM